MMQIHERIKQARISAGLSPEQMAEKVGVPRTTYLYWEEKTPKIDKIMRVTQVLGLPNNYFFDDNVENSVKPIKANSHKEPLAEALAIIKEQNEFLRRLVDFSLAGLSADLNNNTSMIRAEIRGFGKYQLLKSVDFDDREFAKAMAVVDKIYGGELKADDLQDNSG